MGNNHDYIALDWVKGEIKQTLSQAQMALEAFVENKDDTPQMTFCLNHIHQVHGTLQMVEFYGAALLAEEMEKLCQALIEETISSVQESQEVLMESLLQLENYLEHIQRGQRDLPVVLLPILNDLRALQGEPLLSDTSLFTPDLSAAEVQPDIAHNHRMEDEQVLANMRKLRQMYQFSLAGIIRNQDLADNFSYLYKVITRLEKFCQNTPIGKIWWVAIGFLDALQSDYESLSSAPKQLLRELDHQIKLLIDESKTILAKPLPADLLKNLLYYVAKANTSSKRIELLKAQFNLAQALPSQQEVDEERQKLQGPGQETLSSVAEALGEELNHIKDQLDLYVRSDEKDNDNLVKLKPQLIQIANTMAILGLGVARKTVLEQIDSIDKISNSGKHANDQELMDMAGALLYVEANLGSLNEDYAYVSPEKDSGEGDDGFVVPAKQFESAHNAVIFESRKGLDQAKSCIVNFIASQWDHTEIEDVPDLLDSIRGGLQIIPLAQAAKLLEACGAYIRESLLANKDIPDWQQLDRLADAITSIEYYMERLSEGAQDNERILQVAEESVAKLGYPIKDSGEKNVPVLSQYHISDVASESPDSVVKETDEELIDEEILEIFLEEVSEVMDEVQIAMSQLKSDPEDRRALKNLRRAFHTLKGSGRLVGASVIAEIAWPVENLLNKYLDNSEGLDLDVFDLLDAIIDRLPELTEDFSTQSGSQHYEHLIARAEMLANAEASPESLSPEPEPEPEPELEAEQDEDDDLIDDEILEIFIEEAGEVLEAIDSHLPSYLDGYTDQDALKELRRAFHTLKGSGRMVNALTIGESAWAIENLLNRIIDGSILMNNDIADLVKFVVQQMPYLIKCFEQRKEPNFDLAFIEKQTAALALGEFVKPLSSSVSQERPTANQEPAASKAHDKVEKDTVESLDENPVGIDSALLEIFENEAEAHVQCIEDFILQVGDEHTVAVDDNLSRALHTLKGSANTASITPIASIAIPVEKFIKEIRARGIEVDTNVANMLSQAMNFIHQGLKQIETSPQKKLNGADDFLASLSVLKQEVLDSLSSDTKSLNMATQDPQVINIFLTEGLDILLDSEEILNEWQANPVSGDDLSKLFVEVKTLHRGAKVAGLESIAELCECLEDCYGSIDIDRQSPNPAFLTDIKRGHDALIDMMDQLAAGLSITLDNRLLAELRQHIVEQSPESGSNNLKDTSDGRIHDALNDKLDELEKELDDVLPSYSVEDSEGEQKDYDADDSIMDAELAEIFLEEAKELVGGLLPALEQLKEKPDNDLALLQLQRDQHTLKGGARLAGIDAIGDLAEVLEKIFEKLLESKSSISSLMIDLVEDSAKTLTAMLASVEKLEPCESQSQLVERLAYALDNIDSALPVIESDEEIHEPAVINSPSVEISSPLSSFELDPELAEIFLEEAQEIIQNSGELLHRWETNVHDLVVVGELQRELHTLKGGARMAEIQAIGDLSHELETLFELIVDKHFTASSEMISLCLSCHDALANMVDAISEGGAVSSADDLLNKIKQVTNPSEKVTSVSSDHRVDEDEKVTDEIIEVAVQAETGQSLSTEDDFEGDLLSLFIDESKDILSAAAEYLEHWREDEDGVEGIVELQREMHTLKGGARLADVDAIGDLADAVNIRLEKMIDGEIVDQAALHHSVAKAYQELTEMLESLILGVTVQPAPELIAEINQAGSFSQADSISQADGTSKSKDDRPKGQAGETGKLASGHDVYLSERTLLQNISFDDVDAEVLEMFVEEARELIEALEEQISAWTTTPKNEAYNLEIQRILHTLKGGARLSNIPSLADESHELETRLLEAQKKNEAFTGELKQAVLKKQDILLKLVDDIQTIAQSVGEKEGVELAEEQEAIPQKTILKAAPAQDKPVQKIVHKTASQETIRVSANLLDSLVNLAGETSISRGRLEQQISDFGFTLEEMSATIDRLREQLRRMDIETEAQVLFTTEKEGLTAPDYSDFDPLEMDRYSSIQQLSRALTESTSDLQDLRDTLADRSRDAETLLLQQSRINSELQEGLMKTRMIPFSSVVPRLRRIVRQIGGELNKQVDFDALNAEGEMDRSVLERMVAPLEHMLRNALDHGIEPVSERTKAGKPATGMITLSLMREGGNIVLKMKDDGAGVNDKLVLAKAKKQGLVKKSAKPDHHEIMQFIMLPGFSTAEKVTQISGRGVGMDVVASEIKQMGGSIEIESTLGKGTEFTIRLPFTVSVNRALMVNTGEDFYAIPLNTIEGIVRVSPYELEEYYKPDAPLYEYAGRKYKLQYLGKLLHSGHHPKLQGQLLPLPVILVRGSDKPMALQVDSLMGSREIVVKSLGPQFAEVHGASGATILGDGSVVVILDLPALIRDDIAGIMDDVVAEVETQVKETRAPVIMVVDDSVTVRKVTTRLLERNGYDVITARDGVDAIAILQDQKPDVMLLDIEMPRMDGFEVATLVRHDENLKDVPIIMITSRTGQKHKDRALSLGVNEYLGKPFQEHDLLENIERFID